MKYLIYYINFWGQENDVELTANNEEDAKFLCCELYNVKSFISIAASI